jgi:hypothetical protein
MSFCVTLLLLLLLLLLRMEAVVVVVMGGRCSTSCCCWLARHWLGAVTCTQTMSASYEAKNFCKEPSLRTMLRTVGTWQGQCGGGGVVSCSWSGYG